MIEPAGQVCAQRLRSLGLDTLDGAFAFAGQELSKPGLGTRRRVRVPAGDSASGLAGTWYLKCYGPEPVARRLWRRLTSLDARGPASIEAANIARVRAAGVSTMECLAVGSQRDWLGERRGYLVVTAVPGESLERSFDAFLARGRGKTSTGGTPVPPKHTGGTPVPPVAVDAFDRALCELLVRLHRAGLCHRDLYACHIFLEPGPPLRLHLIDLARVFRPCWRRFRWRVKDLAQLKFSMPAEWAGQRWNALLAGYLADLVGTAEPNTLSRGACNRAQSGVDAPAARTQTSCHPNRGGRLLKIALVIERLFPSRGGRERSVHEIATALAHRGHQVSVLCQDGQASQAYRVMELGRPAAARWRVLVQFMRRTIETAAAERFDVIHATLPVPGAHIYQPRGGTVPAQAAARMRQCGPAGRFLRVLTGPINLTRRLLGQLEQHVAEDERTVCLAVSRMVAQEFADYFGRTKNVRVIYNGVAVPAANDARRSADRAHWRARWGTADQATVFLMAAQNLALKGAAEAIDAYADFARRTEVEDRLVIVGGRNPGPLRKRARRRGLAEKVVFEPAVDDVFPLYSAADAVVQLSWYDACSRVVLEALRWGLPALTTGFNGAAELLADGVGLVVDSPADRAAVASALAKLADPAARQAMIERGRAVREQASMDRQVRELEGLYQEVARR